MEIRLREREFLAVTILAALSFGGYVFRFFSLSHADRLSKYADPFVRNDLSFNVYTNILLPQLSQVVVPYLAYVYGHWQVTRWIRRQAGSDQPMPPLLTILLVLLNLLFVGFLLAFAANISSYYGRPAYFHYGHAEFHYLALFGFNAKPMTNVFFGLIPGIGLAAAYFVWVLLRESFLYWFTTRKRDFSLAGTILNHVSTALVITLAVGWFLRIFLFHEIPHLFQNMFLTFALATNGVYLSNTFWLFPSRTKRGSWDRETWTKLLLSTFGIALLSVIWLPQYLLPATLHFPGIRLLYYFGFWMAQLLITTPLSWLLYEQNKVSIDAFRGLQSELKKSQADLQLLRSQINPHFLFNALNTLYGTALSEKSSRTADGIQKLGNMMRFMLQDNHRDRIPLKKEIEYLTDYIDLQKLRTQISDSIQIETEIVSAASNHQVAPMLLIPFVENAFKHGISLNHPSWIHIRLKADHHKLSFEVINSLHRKTGLDLEQDRSGIGLQNVAERLRLLYPNRHDLSYGPQEKQFIAHLKLQF